MQNRTRYDRESFLNVLTQLKDEDLLPFIKNHLVEIDRINDGKLACSIYLDSLQRLLKRGLPKSPEFAKICHNNTLVINELISLLRPQLSAIRDFELISTTFKSIDKLEDPNARNIHYSSYDFAKFALAKTIRLAITDGKQLTTILTHIRSDDRLSFIEAQEDFWSERDFIRAREDAIRAEQQTNVPSKSKEEACQTEVKQDITPVTASVSTLRHSPILFSPVSPQNDRHVNVEHPPVTPRKSM